MSRPETDAPTDGRRLRSAGSRRRIIAATIDLVAAGNPSPTAELIATKARVSLRTVFRHFEEMDKLYSEIAISVHDRVRPHLEAPLPTGSWEEVMDMMIERHRALFEELRPFRRAIEMHSYGSEVLREQQALIRKMHRVRLEQMLPAAVVADQTLFDLLLALLSLDTWQRLVEQQGLSADDAAAVLKRALADLTAPVIARG